MSAKKLTKVQQLYADVYNAVPENVLAKELGFEVICGSLRWLRAEDSLAAHFGQISAMQKLWDKCLALYLLVHPELAKIHAKKLAAVQKHQEKSR